MSKRIIAALLITGIMFTFAACKNGSQVDDRVTNPGTRETEPGNIGAVTEPNQTINTMLPSETTATETTTEPETSETSDASETTSSSSTSTTATTTAKALGKVKVTDAYKKNYSKNQWGYKASVKIPKITIEGVSTKAINKEILNYCKKKSGSERSCSYSYYIGKTYVSIVITLHDEHDMSPAYWFKVYNISRSSGKKMSKKAMLKALGISSKKFHKRVKKAVIKMYKKSYGYTSKSPSWVKREYKKATSAKMIKTAIPCVNSKGKLCYMISQLPSPGGAGQYDEYGTC